MFRKTMIALAATAATVGAVLPGAAQAQYRGGQPSRYERGYDARYEQARYQPVRYRSRGYRGGDRCYDKGNGGLAIGGIAGGLLGNEVAGRGDKTLGAVLGAAVGALAGRAIDKSDGRRC